MGFSTVAAQLMFFIAVVAISGGLISIFGTYIDQASMAMGDRQNLMSERLRTSIDITSIDNTSGHLRVYAKNTGTTQLKTECVDLFIDGGYVNLAAANIVDPADGVTQIRYWDSKTTIRINVPEATLNSNTIHQAKLITCNGITDTENF
jgi:archaellum component FlaF (FlaF/FlaG flagellin family)